MNFWNITVQFAQAEAQFFREIILEVIIMWLCLSAAQLQYEELRLLQHPPEQNK